MATVLPNFGNVTLLLASRQNEVNNDVFHLRDFSCITLDVYCSMAVAELLS